MKKLCAFVLLFFICTMSIAQEKAHEPKETPIPVVTKEKPMSYWMEQKLEYSKKILEALTKGDFVALEETAEKMRILGKIEGLVRRKNPVYTMHLQTFEKATLEVARQARLQKAEGATLAFHQLTTTCIACHKTLRDSPSTLE